MKKIILLSLSLLIAGSALFPQQNLAFESDKLKEYLGKAVAVALPIVVIYLCGKYGDKQSTVSSNAVSAIDMNGPHLASLQYPSYGAFPPKGVLGGAFTPPAQGAFKFN